MIRKMDLQMVTDLKVHMGLADLKVVANLRVWMGLTGLKWEVSKNCLLPLNSPTKEIFWIMRLIIKKRNIYIFLENNISIPFE